MTRRTLFAVLSRVQPVLLLTLSALLSHCASAELSGPDGAAGSGSGAGAGSTQAGSSAAGFGAGAGHAGTFAVAGSGGGRAGMSGNAGVSGVTGAAGSGGASGTGAGASGGIAAAGGGSSGGAAAGAGASASLPGWSLIFSDEFNEAAGAGIDASKWKPMNKGDGFGNNELQFYTDRRENLAQDGQGSLVITARKETYQGRDYTSARLETLGAFEQKYGRFEARLRIPRGQGLWPAFWMLGADINDVSWPNCGEIDIMENVGKEPMTVHGTLHGPGYSGGNPIGASYESPNGKAFADDFHTFAVEWEENIVRFYVDGTMYKSRTPADVPNGAPWVYDHPFFLLLNVAVGGQWPGSPDGTTTFPQTMSVDYVRVYERDR